jgi:hypothetical protein
MKNDPQELEAVEEVAYEIDGQYVTKDQYDSHRRSKRDALHGQFSRQRDDWVAHRASLGVESRWRRAQALYLGDEDSGGDSALTDTLKNGPTRAGSGGQVAARSKVVVNIVRPKVDQAVARMAEILLPVDDRNWGIKPTPVPEAISQMVGDTQRMVPMPDGSQVTADAASQIFMKKMKDSAKGMADEIDDVLNESDYNGQQRALLEDGVRLGAGMMLGPFPKMQPKRKWVEAGDGLLKLEIGHEAKPASRRVDPWDVYFDKSCGNDHHRGSGFYLRSYITRKELRALALLDGYDADIIRETLMVRPTRTRVTTGRVERTTSDEESYEMWVYYGQVEPDDIGMLSESMKDPLENVENGIIVMVENRIIGAMESWIPDGSLPLDVWCWRDADDSPYGYGLPDEMSHQQRVVNAAWRQVMDNAKITVGGQLVMKKGRIKPQNGSYALEPNKIWLADDEVEDVTKAMTMIEFSSHLAELLTIAEAAMKFADQETSMPQIMGGEKGTAPETVGGMVMLYNNANVVLRLRVKLYDDKITRHHISRHYDWQMAHSKKRHIKGDMEVDARGSTALLEKDIQNQATLNLANITSNPRYQAFIDPKEELRTILKAFKITPEDIMLTDDKIEKNLQAAAQNPPQDPNIIRAQAQVQVKQMDVQDRAEDRAHAERAQAAELQHKNASLAYNTEREQKEFTIAMAQAQLERDITLLRAASDESENELERQARARLEAMNLDSKHQLFNAEAALRVNTGAGI